MKRLVWCFSLTVSLGLFSWAQTAKTNTTQPKTQVKKKAATAPSTKKGPARASTQKAGTTKPAATKAGTQKTGTQAKTASRVSSSRKGVTAKRRVAPAGPPRQLTPTPDRYREIQQALVDKGYLKSEANGTWDAQSSDALRQFQNDQKLPPTGKITAASLIGLGLGPRAASSLPETVTAPGQAPAAGPVDLPPAPEVLPVPDAAPSH
jgi:hypothetical protein